MRRYLELFQNEIASRTSSATLAIDIMPESTSSTPVNAARSNVVRINSPPAIGEDDTGNANDWGDLASQSDGEEEPEPVRVTGSGVADADAGDADADDDADDAVADANAVADGDAIADSDADSDYVQPDSEIVGEIEERDDVDDDTTAVPDPRLNAFLGACKRFKAISDFNVPRIVSCDVTRRKARVIIRWAVTKALRDLGITGVRGGETPLALATIHNQVKGLYGVYMKSKTPHKMLQKNTTLSKSPDQWSKYADLLAEVDATLRDLSPEELRVMGRDPCKHAGGVGHVKSQVASTRASGLEWSHELNSESPLVTPTSSKTVVEHTTEGEPGAAPPSTAAVDPPKRPSSVPRDPRTRPRNGLRAHRNPKNDVCERHARNERKHRKRRRSTSRDRSHKRQRRSRHGHDSSRGISRDQIYKRERKSDRSRSPRNCGHGRGTPRDRSGHERRPYRPFHRYDHRHEQPYDRSRRVARLPPPLPLPLPFPPLPHHMKSHGTAHRYGDHASCEMKVFIWDDRAQNWGDVNQVSVHRHETVQQVFGKVLGRYDEVENATFVSGNFCGSSGEEQWKKVPSLTEVCMGKYPADTRFAIRVTNQIKQLRYTLNAFVRGQAERKEAGLH